MLSIKSSGTFTSAGLVSAFAASLCCIAPVIALLAGSGSIAANFSWIEPARPYLIGLSIAVLAFAWYLKLKPAKSNETDCNCDTPKKASFIQSKTFLAIVTAFAILMMTFPLYAKVFYPNPKTQSTIVAVADNKQQVKFTIEGMTCESCEEHVNKKLSEVPGVLSYTTSYASQYSLVSFDKLKVDVKSIEEAINKTGYKVTGFSFMGMSTASLTFYEVPLICNAAPNIGCGSRSKPALVELEKNPAVKEAWLNRPGTVIAIVWKDKPQTEIAKPIFDQNAIAYTELTEKEAISYKQSFGEENLWYRGADVDKLSKEEATIIAESAVKFAIKNKLITQTEAKSIKADVEAYFKDELVKLRTNEELNADSENKFMQALYDIAEKYIGKDRAKSAMKLYQQSCEEKCDKDKSCSEKTGKACCDKNK